MQESDTLQRHYHFTFLSDEIIDNEKVTKEGLLVYLALARFADKSSKCFPSLKTLAEKGRMSKSSVQRGIENLIDCGYVEKKGRTVEGKKEQTSNIYTLYDHRRGGYTQGEHTYTQGEHRGIPKGSHEVDTSEVDTNKKREGRTTKEPSRANDPPPDSKNTQEKKPGLYEHVTKLWRRYNPAATLDNQDKALLAEVKTQRSIEDIVFALSTVWEENASKPPKWALKDFNWNLTRPEPARERKPEHRDCPNCGKKTFLAGGICMGCGLEVKNFDNEVVITQMTQPVTAPLVTVTAS